MANKAAAARLAVLIDGENIPAKYARVVIDQANELGIVVEVRVYGHFDSEKLNGWKAATGGLGLIQVNVPRQNTRKNAADFRLVVEAMDMLHTRHLDGFCLASSDGDFMALAERLRSDAHVLYGFGEKKAPPAYQAAFTRFFDCATLVTQAKAATPKQQSAAKPAPSPAPAPKPTGGHPLPRGEILAAIDATRRKDGWSNVSAIAKHLKEAMPGFSSRTYGHSQTSKLILSVGGIESKPATSGGGVQFVRRKS